tara:strand:- start:2344 stop:2496 length:153 start_codon:yes stop_codon:yes gene_type:complete
MEELPKNKAYYRKNKELWKKGGKYYNYTPKSNSSDIKLVVKRGSFLISFD